MATVLALNVCRNCGWDIAGGDLFCAYCGVETGPVTAAPGPPAATAGQLRRAECSSCGASMAFDATRQAVTCPFCGSTRLASPANDVPRAEPTAALPFTIDRPAAIAAFTAFAKSSFWYPDDLAATGHIEALRQVFVPAWRFSGQTAAFWTADTTAGAAHTWRPIAGADDTPFVDLVLLASAALTPRELTALGSFDLAGLGPVDTAVAGAAAVTEVPRISQHMALQRLPSTVQAWQQDRLADRLPGRTRQVHCDQIITDVRGALVVLPVWIAAYRYRDQAYRFLVNGSTGQSTGQAPISALKVILVGLLVGLAAGLLLAGWLMQQAR